MKCPDDHLMHYEWVGSDANTIAKDNDSIDMSAKQLIQLQNLCQRDMPWCLLRSNDDDDDDDDEKDFLVSLYCVRGEQEHKGIGKGIIHI